MTPLFSYKERSVPELSGCKKKCDSINHGGSTFTNNEIEIDRERLREIKDSYDDDEVFNFDKTSFFFQSFRAVIRSIAPMLSIYKSVTQRNDSQWDVYTHLNRSFVEIKREYDSSTSANLVIWVYSYRLV